MKITEHFTLEELTKTSQPLQNLPTASATVQICRLVFLVLEPTRQTVGFPLYINSCFRSPAVNAAVGGVKNSRHLTGQAADIHCKSQEQYKRVFAALRTNKHVDLCLFEHKGASQWIHVQMSDEPRHIFNDNYIVR